MSARTARPLQVPSVGRRRRAPMPAANLENFGSLGRDFVARDVPVSLLCPECRTPFENDGDRYFMAGCLNGECGWRR